MQTIFMFVGLLTLVFSGVSDAQSVDAGFNDTRCSDGRVVCFNDPLLYICTVINSGSSIATVTLPSGVGVQIDDDNETSIVGAVSLPAGVKLQFYDARISDSRVNYTISLALERADLINNSGVSCDTHAAGSTPILKNCVFTMDPPGPPEGLRQNVSADTESSVVVEWRSPGSTGGNGITISDYTVSISGVRSETVSGDVISHTITGLVFNTQYTVSVTAINSCGLSSSSSATTNIFIHASAPPTPNILNNIMMECNVANTDGREVNVTWEDGMRNNSVIYLGDEMALMTLNPPAVDTIECSNSLCTATVNSNERYNVSVRVTNDIGLSAPFSMKYNLSPLEIRNNLNSTSPHLIIKLNEYCNSNAMYKVSVGFENVSSAEQECSPQTIDKQALVGEVMFNSNFTPTNDKRIICYLVTLTADDILVTEITGYGETGTTDQHTNNTASSSSDIVPIIVGSCAAGVFAIGTPVTILSIIAYFRKDKEDKDSTDQAAMPLRETKVPVSPGASDMESGPLYQEPNTISRTAHPDTGQLYTDVNLKTRRDDQGYDPSPIEHQTSPGGEEYAMPQKKSGKKKEQEPEDELTEEQKSAMYSVPDKKGQKAKSQGLLYTEVSIGSSSKPAPPSQGSNYADIQHN